MPLGRASAALCAFPGEDAEGLQRARLQDVGRVAAEMVLLDLDPVRRPHRDEHRPGGPFFLVRRAANSRERHREVRAGQPRRAPPNCELVPFPAKRTTPTHSSASEADADAETGAIGIGIGIHAEQ